MRIKRLIAITLILAALPLTSAVLGGRGMTAAADAAATDKIKVGFFAFPGYHEEERAADGTVHGRSGYGYDFVQLVACYTAFEYEYVGYDKPFDECLAMLDSGEADIVTSVSDKPERREKYLFSDKKIGDKSTIFTVKAGNTKIKKGDYRTYGGITVGMLKNNSSNAVFEEFSQNPDRNDDTDDGFVYTPAEYDTEAELASALAEGEVDGIVTSDLRKLKDEWVIESLSPNPFYACTSKDNPELMAKINAAIEGLDAARPDWRDELHDKYYSTDAQGNVVFTLEEEEYLQRLREGEKLKVIVNPDRAPYSYYRDGQAAGIFPAIFDKICAGMNVTVDYVPIADRSEYYRLRDGKQADIVIDFSDDYFIAEQSGYKISEIYYTTTHTMIKRRNLKGDPKKFAVIGYVDNSYSSGYLDRYVSSGTSTRTFNSIDESVAAVRDGVCDATITLSYVAERFMWADENSELVSELIGEAASAYTVGVKNGADTPLLLSVINKCIDSLDRSTINALVSDEVTVFRPTGAGGLWYFLRHNPAYIAVISTVVLVLIFAIVLVVLRAYNRRNLRRKVDEATEMLRKQTDELSEALHAADAANRSKTTFLNNMSHDIRTPMNAIIGFTALATTHLDNKERALDYLGKISQASNHLLSLINDVLDMSRIESGKTRIESRPENLADILQGLRNIIQSDIHAKHLELYIDTVDITDEEIYCDKLRLNQILLNLTSNSIKFTKSGGAVFVKVTQKPCDKPGYGNYEFSVADTGIGMSQEFIKVIFDPFTREHTATVSGIQGTGLGMAITKNIVDIMGGTISVKSEQGRGSEFTVNLQFKLAESQPELAALTELHGLNALVVDDDVVSCQSVSKMLRRIGMVTQWTVTGKEAVIRTTEAVELGHPFEVYIVDWSMPDMDGIATVTQIRSIIGDDSPIILMSAYDWTDIEQEARKAGVTGFLSKPLFASDLHRALELSLGKLPKKQPEEKQKPDFGGKRLLLVEDNELNREIAVELLSESGFTVETAENGSVAVDMVADSEEGYYDLILMDVQMPVMDGYEASRRIRALPNKALSSIPIIAMTANAFEEDKANAYAAGMNGHLAKPIDVEAMLSVLGSVLSGKPLTGFIDSEKAEETATATDGTENTGADGVGGSSDSNTEGSSDGADNGAPDGGTGA